MELSAVKVMTPYLVRHSDVNMTIIDAPTVHDTFHIIGTIKMGDLFFVLEPLKLKTETNFSAHVWNSTQQVVGYIHVNSSPRFLAKFFNEVHDDDSETH